MKTKVKFWTICIVLLANVSIIYSQSNKASFGVSGGLAQEGYGGKLSFNYNNSASSFIQASVLATFSKEQFNTLIEIPYDTYSFNLGYYIRALKTRKDNLNVYIGGGGSVGYERVNNGSTDLVDGSLLASKSSMVYGGFVGLDIDLYLSDSISFIVQTDGFYHFGSNLGNISAYAGGGFRFYLN